MEHILDLWSKNPNLWRTYIAVTTICRGQPKGKYEVRQATDNGVSRIKIDLAGAQHLTGSQCPITEMVELRQLVDLSSRVTVRRDALGQRP